MEGEAGRAPIVSEFGAGRRVPASYTPLETKHSECRGHRPFTPFVQQVLPPPDQNEGEGSLQRGGIGHEGRLFFKCKSKHLIFQLSEETISWKTLSQKCV